MRHRHSQATVKAPSIPPAEASCAAQEHLARMTGGESPLSAAAQALLYGFFPDPTQHTPATAGQTALMDLIRLSGSSGNGSSSFSSGLAAGAGFARPSIGGGDGGSGRFARPGLGGAFDGSGSFALPSIGASGVAGGFSRLSSGPGAEPTGAARPGGGGGGGPGGVVRRRSSSLLRSPEGPEAWGALPKKVKRRTTSA